MLAVLGAEIDVDLLRATLNPLDRYVVLVDDAEMLYNAPDSEILERIIVSGRDTDHGYDPGRRLLADLSRSLQRLHRGRAPVQVRGPGASTPWPTATCSASGSRATLRPLLTRAGRPALHGGVPTPSS